MAPEPPPIANPHSTETRVPASTVKRGGKTKAALAFYIGLGVASVPLGGRVFFTLSSLRAFSRWPQPLVIVVVATTIAAIGALIVGCVAGALRAWNRGE